MNKRDVATQAIILATIVAIVVGLSSLIPHLRPERFAPVALPASPQMAPAQLHVYVSGAVSHPGIYTLLESSSLGDILELVHARSDGSASRIDIIIDDAPGQRAPQRIDLNHADPWLLEALPGIGPERAQAIVEHRMQRGPFNSTAELTLVPGIGTATYEGLKEFVTVTL